MNHCSIFKTEGKYHYNIYMLCLDYSNIEIYYRN